jgi:hypothetical protein
MYIRPAHFDLPCADRLTQSTASQGTEVQPLAPPQAHSPYGLEQRSTADTLYIVSILTSSPCVSAALPLLCKGFTQIQRKKLVTCGDARGPRDQPVQLLFHTPSCPSCTMQMQDRDRAHNTPEMSKPCRNSYSVSTSAHKPFAVQKCLMHTKATSCLVAGSTSAKAKPLHWRRQPGQATALPTTPAAPPGMGWVVTPSPLKS